MSTMISVITVTYNIVSGGRLSSISRCVESVHSQSYKYVEHIVVDGGSNDGTQEILEEFKAKGWISFISEKDQGIYDAMNKGAKLAKGKYITFLNSDDYYHDQRGLEKSILALEKSGATFSYAPVMIKSSGTDQPAASHIHTRPNIANVFFQMPFSHQSMIMKRKVLIKEGMFDINYQIAGDYDLVLRLCLKETKSAQLSDSFVTFGWGGISATAIETSTKEVARVHYSNYHSICSLTKTQAATIYGQNYGHIPIELGCALMNNIYFDTDLYFEYLDKARLYFLNNKDELKLLRAAFNQQRDELNKLSSSNYVRFALKLKKMIGVNLR